MSVASVGDNCIDRYLGPPARDLPGGNALNVAVHLAAAGLDAAYVGVIGEDADGKLLMVAAQAAGVDVSRVEVSALGRTGVTVVRHEDGDRVFVTETYGVAADVRLTSDVVAALSDRVWVHATRVAGAAAGLAELRGRGIGTSYDIGEAHDRAVMAAIAPHLDVAFASAPTGDAGDVAGWLRAAGAAAAVVTRGAAGAVLVDHGGVYELPADEVAVVDTLGAGDALIGGFIAARVRGSGNREALVAGTAAAARTCAHVGAWPS